ncbi:MAG: hypothetical protein V4490_02600 [Pseudomonadota bacterium]
MQRSSNSALDDKPESDRPIESVSIFDTLARTTAALDRVRTMREQAAALRSSSFYPGSRHGDQGSDSDTFTLPAHASGMIHSDPPQRGPRTRPTTPAAPVLASFARSKLNGGQVLSQVLPKKALVRVVYPHRPASIALSGTFKNKFEKDKIFQTAFERIQKNLYFLSAALFDWRVSCFWYSGPFSSLVKKDVPDVTEDFYEKFIEPFNCHLKELLEALEDDLCSNLSQFKSKSESELSTEEEFALGTALKIARSEFSDCIRAVVALNDTCDHQPDLVSERYIMEQQYPLVQFLSKHREFMVALSAMLKFVGSNTVLPIDLKFEVSESAARTLQEDPVEPVQKPMPQSATVERVSPEDMPTLEGNVAKLRAVVDRVTHASTQDASMLPTIGIRTANPPIIARMLQAYLDREAELRSNGPPAKKECLPGSTLLKPQKP